MRAPTNTIFCSDYRSRRNLIKLPVAASGRGQTTLSCPQPFAAFIPPRPSRTSMQRAWHLTDICSFVTQSVLSSLLQLSLPVLSSTQLGQCSSTTPSPHMVDFQNFPQSPFSAVYRDKVQPDHARHQKFVHDSISFSFSRITYGLWSISPAASYSFMERGH